MTQESPQSRRDYQSAAVIPKNDSRPLPASLDAEKGVLCSILIDQSVIDDLSHITPSHFHHPAHGTIYQVMQDMRDGDRKIDMNTVFMECHDKNLIDQIGGNSIIQDIRSFLPASEEYRFYAETLVEKYTRRQAIALMTAGISELFQESFGSPNEMLAETIASLQDLTRDKDSLVQHIKKYAMDSIESLERISKSEGKINGVATGFRNLDNTFDGLKGGQMVVIAARPSMGKSALGMQMIVNAATAGVPCAVFSLEMSGEQLTTRIICATAGKSLKNIKSGFVAKSEMSAIGNSAFRLANLPIYIDETASTPINSIKSKARAFKQAYGIGLIMIDYLQLATSLSKRAQNSKVIEVTEISNGIKAIAKELKIPVIVLAQLNRDIEKRKGGKPVLSDLKDSGSIEQDADIVIFIHRPKEKEAEEAEIIVAKNRDGPCGYTPLWFDGPTTSFKEITP